MVKITMGSQSLFTLGDVADILDSALDTGISIVDALSKLSNLADEGSLPGTNEVDVAKKTNNNSNVFDENDNILDANNAGFDSNENNDPNNSHILSDDSGMSSGSSMHLGNKSSDILSDEKSVDNMFDTVHREINAFNNKGYHIVSKEDGDGDGLPNRCGTYVLPKVEKKIEKHLRDESFNKIPVVQAIGNLCHIADDVLNCEQNGNADINNSTSSSEVLNIKVNSMLQSFQKLDETVEKLKQHALQKHLFSHPEDKDILVGNHSTIQTPHVTQDKLPSSVPSTPVTLRKHKPTIAGRPSTYLVDNTSSQNRKVNNDVNALNERLQTPDTFSYIAQPYTRQLSQETYILDDETASNDESMSIDDQELDLTSNVVNKRPRDTYVLNLIGNVKHQSKKDGFVSNHVVEGNYKSIHRPVTNKSKSSSNDNTGNGISNLFYQGKPSDVSSRLLDGKNTNEKQKLDSETTQSFERNVSSRSTYVLNCAPPIMNNGVKVVNHLDTEDTQQDLNVPPFLRKKKCGNRNRKSNRQTYVISEPEDSNEKVENKELKYEGIRNSSEFKTPFGVNNELKYEVRRNSCELNNKTPFGVNNELKYDVRRNSSEQKTLYGMNNELEARRNSSENIPFGVNKELKYEAMRSSSGYKTPYDINNSIELTDGNKCNSPCAFPERVKLIKNEKESDIVVPFTRSDARSTYILSKTDNNVTKQKNRNKSKFDVRKPDHVEKASLQPSDDSVVPPDNVNRSTYVLADSNINKSARRKLSSNKFNSEFFRNANTMNNEVMFYVGKKQDMNYEDGRVQQSSAEKTDEVSTYSDMEEQKLSQAKSKDCGTNNGINSLPNSNVSSTIKETDDISRKTSSGSSSDTVIEEFELLYEINNPGDVVNSDKVNVNKEETLTEELGDESLEEFELIYEIAVPSGKETVSNFITSRENTFVKEENVDNEGGRDLADKAESICTKSRENTFIKEELDCVDENSSSSDGNDESLSSELLDESSTSDLLSTEEMLWFEKPSKIVSRDAEEISFISHELLNIDSKSSEEHNLKQKKYTRSVSLDTFIDSSCLRPRTLYTRSLSTPSASEMKHLSCNQKDLFLKLDTLHNLMSSSLTKLNALNYIHKKSNDNFLLDEESCEDFVHNRLHLCDTSLDSESSVVQGTQILQLDEHEDGSGIKSSTPNSSTPSYELDNMTYNLNSVTCSDKLEGSIEEEEWFSSETYEHSISSSIEEMCQLQAEETKDIEILIDEPSEVKMDATDTSATLLNETPTSDINFEKTRYLSLSDLFFNDTKQCQTGHSKTSSVSRSDTFVLSPRDEKKLKHSSVGVSRNDTFLVNEKSSDVSFCSSRKNESMEKCSSDDPESHNRHCKSAVTKVTQVNTSRPSSADCIQKRKCKLFSEFRRNSSPNSNCSDSPPTRVCPVSYSSNVNTSCFNTSTTSTNLYIDEQLTYSNNHIHNKTTTFDVKDSELFYSPGKMNDLQFDCNQIPVRMNSGCENNGLERLCDSKASKKKRGTTQHTNFLKRKSVGFSKQRMQNKENEDETLSIQLAALRMQLEEKRRKFDEEKKRKQEQWREERAKNLQNAFFVMLNNNEEQVDLSLEMDNLQGPACEPIIIPDQENEEVNFQSYEVQKASYYNEDIGRGVVETESYDMRYENTICYTHDTNKLDELDNIPDKKYHELIQNETEFFITQTDPPINPTEIHTDDVVISNRPLSTLIQEFSHFSDPTVLKTKPVVGYPTADPISSVLNELGKNDDVYLTTVNQSGNTPELSTVLDQLGGYSKTQELSTVSSVVNTYPYTESEFLTNTPNNIQHTIHHVIATDERPKLLNVIDNEHIPSTTIDAVLAQVGSSPLASLDYTNILQNEEIINYDENELPPSLENIVESNLVDTNVQKEIPRFENVVSKDELPRYENDRIHIVDYSSVSTPLQIETALQPPDTLPEQVSQESAAKTPSATSFVVGVDMMGTPELTPQQIKKRERFLRQRQKNIEEERERKAAELEKKLRLEESTPKKTVKEERPRTTGNNQESSNKRNEQVLQDTPRKAKREVITPRTPRTPQNTTPVVSSTPDESSKYTEYTGPDAYKKPTGKSNRKIIQNAIMHCCLCGEVNKENKNKCLDALEKSEANHFLVLFREGLKFRSVYEYHPDTEAVTRVYGIGPKMLNEKMMIKYYKYNSGGKEFYSLETKHLSIQVDGLMIKKELWEKKQGNSKTDSNLKKLINSNQR